MHKFFYISPKKKKKKYFNPHLKKVRRSLWHFFLWKIGFYNKKKQISIPPENFSFPFKIIPLDFSKPKVTWIGHSSFLIEYKKICILTDPIWSRVCSPISFIGPKRRHPPGIDINDLPEIDFVLISHNHYDHLDEKTVKILFQKYPHIQWIVPLGLKKWFQKRNIENVWELSWEESLEFFGKVKIVATPTQHFSGRGIFDLNKTLWNGYILEFDPTKKMYFVGDTGYNPIDFKEIGKKHKNIDLSLIPIGTYVPELFMLPVHINPAQAVEIHKEIGSKLSIGMHWKTFRLSDELLNLPPYDLFQAIKKAHISPKEFVVIEPGVSLNW